MAGGVDFEEEVEELRNVFSGFGAGQEDRGVGEEVEVALEVVQKSVNVVFFVGFIEVEFCDDDNNSLSSFDDLAGEGLVELGVGLGGVDEEGADVGLLNRGESAEGGELFDADFAFSGLSKAGGVEDFDLAFFVANGEAVDVAGGSLAGGDYCLLLLSEGVKEGGFADVGAADEGEGNPIVANRLFSGRVRSARRHGRATLTLGRSLRIPREKRFAIDLIKDGGF